MLQNCGRWTSKEADQKSQRWREPESCPEAAAVRLPGGAGRPAGAAPRLRGASGSVLRQWRDVRQRREQLIVRSEIAYNNHLDNLVTDGVHSIVWVRNEIWFDDEKMIIRTKMRNRRCNKLQHELDPTAQLGWSACWTNMSPWCLVLIVVINIVRWQSCLFSCWELIKELPFIAVSSANFEQGLSFILLYHVHFN